MLRGICVAQARRTLPRRTWCRAGLAGWRSLGGGWLADSPLPPRIFIHSPRRHGSGNVREAACDQLDRERLVAGFAYISLQSPYQKHAN